MYPTLNKNMSGGTSEFGIVDNHKMALDNLKRFDIITTYYPVPYNTNFDYCYMIDNVEIPTNYEDTEHEVKLSKYAEFKIKRLLALPGEQFYITQDAVVTRSKDDDGKWGEWVTNTFPFTHNEGTGKTFGEELAITLGKDEYWVIGDNWKSSTDCATLNHPIYRGNIQGVLVAIEGTCEVSSINGIPEVKNKKYYPQFRYYKR